MPRSSIDLAAPQGESEMKIELRDREIERVPKAGSGASDEMRLGDPVARTRIRRLYEFP